MAFDPRVAGPLRLAVLLFAALSGWGAESLQVRSDANGIRVSSTSTQFLAGKSLERLHNGAPVVFALQLTLLTGARRTVLSRSGGRFALSFDIWEEKFAVTRLTNPRKSASHLSGAEAEAWCWDNLALSSASLSRDTAFWIRLEVRAEAPDEGPAPGEEAGVTLAWLVDIFSRPQREGEARTRTEAGPFRLRDLR